MKVAGRATVNAPREAVFAAICDPGSLLEIIPGCREISRVSDDEYQGRIELRLPAIVGSYATVVRLVRTDPPASGELEGRVQGRTGSIAGGATFRLVSSGEETIVEYEGAATVSGPLARLDSRFMEGIAQSLIGQGLARLDRRLQQVPAEARR